MELRYAVGALWIAVLSVGCTHGATIYAPDDAVLSRLTRSAAVKQARTGLERANGLHAGLRDIDRGSIRISAREIRYLKDRSPEILDVAELDPGAIKVKRTTGMRFTEYWIFLKGFAQVFLPSEASAREFADAIYALARYARGASAPLDASAEAEFANAAARYREAASKPELPEAAREFRIQAEAALRDKDFDEAAGFYAEALRLAPWWPEGRFNRALILAELGAYDEAMSEMGKYMMLAPDALNARAAQDTIYEWKAKAQRSR